MFLKSKNSTFIANWHVTSNCSILDVPYDCSAEADLLYSLIAKARFENNRYQKPKKQPKNSTQHVDWFWMYIVLYLYIYQIDSEMFSSFNLVCVVIH